MNIPEGWKLVPIEPTDEMAAAAIKASFDHPSAINGLPQYRAMLSVSPNCATSSLCPGHGRPECVSCCWPAAEQPAGYTAVDMNNAAADGYRDGKANFEVEFPDSPGHYYNGVPSSATADPMKCWRDGYARAIERFTDAGGKVK